MCKALPNIVSVLLFASILTGCGNLVDQYDRAGYTSSVKGRAIPNNQLGALPHNTDITNIWSIRPHKYESDIQIDDKNKTPQTYTLYGDTIFVLDDNGVLSAYHLETNKLYWQKKFSFKKTILSPYIKAVDGVVVIGVDNMVYGVDTTSGGIAWSRNLPDGINSHISARKGIALFQSDAYASYAIDIKNGDILWRHQARKNAVSYAHTASLHLRGDNAYVVYPLGDIYALDLKTGRVLWAKSLGMPIFAIDANILGSYTDEIVVVGENIYIGSGNGIVYALNHKNGAALWSKTISSNVNMTAVGKVLYIVGKDSVVRAVSANHGDVFWSVNLNEIVKRAETSILYTHFYKGKIILFTKMGEIIMLSIDTGVLIAIHNTIPVIAPPMNKVGKLILLDGNGNLKAYK